MNLSLGVVPRNNMSKDCIYYNEDCPICPEPLPVTKKADTVHVKVLSPEASDRLQIAIEENNKKTDKPFDKEKFERMAAEVKKTFEKEDWEERFDKVWRESLYSSRSDVALEGKDIKSFIQEERNQLLNAMEEIIPKDKHNIYCSAIELKKEHGYRRVCDCYAESRNNELQELRSALERLRGKR